MTPPDPDEPRPESFSSVEETRRAHTEQDGVASLHDSEAASGDEEGLEDSFDLDQLEARELGVDLDQVEGPEPGLD